ncbi:hypothetical protein KEM55_000884, partial [Ascosphaera atra]
MEEERHQRRSGRVHSRRDRERDYEVPKKTSEPALHVEKDAAIEESVLNTHTAAGAAMGGTKAQDARSAAATTNGQAKHAADVERSSKEHMPSKGRRISQYRRQQQREKRENSQRQRRSQDVVETTKHHDTNAKGTNTKKEDSPLKQGKRNRPLPRSKDQVTMDGLAALTTSFIPVSEKYRKGEIRHDVIETFPVMVIPQRHSSMHPGQLERITNGNGNGNSISNGNGDNEQHQHRHDGEKKEKEPVRAELGGEPETPPPIDRPERRRSLNALATVYPSAANGQESNGV